MSKTIEDIGLIVAGIALAVISGGTLAGASWAIISSSSLAGTLFGVGVTAGLGGAIGLLTPTPKPVSGQGSLFISQAAQYWRVIYGVFQTAGVLAYAQFPFTSNGSDQNPDANHQHLHLVYTIASHQIIDFCGINNNVPQVYIDGIASPLAFDPTSGYWKPSNSNDPYYGHIFFEFDLGTINGVPFPNLNAACNGAGGQGIGCGPWTIACKQEGRAKVHVNLMYDQAYNSNPPAGKPALYVGGRIPNIQFQVTGKRILDTRVQLAWQPSSSIMQYQFVVDPLGFVQVNLGSAFTTGSTAPTWNDTTGGTTSDNGGTWTCFGPPWAGATAGWAYTNQVIGGTWQGAAVFSAYTVIEQPIGFLQISVAGLTTGSSLPNFSVTRGGTTSDNGGTWVCIGPSGYAYSPSAAFALGGVPSFDTASNPALCVYDYLTDTKIGLGAAPASVDSFTVLAAANNCGQPLGLPTSTTEPTYSCNGMFDTSAKRGDVLAALLKSMAGWAVPPGDLWRVYSGGYNSPVLTLTDADFRDVIKGDFQVSRRDISNAVRGTFIPAFLPTNSTGSLPATWQTADFPPYEADGVNGRSNYISVDGQVIWKDIQLDFVTSLWTSQRLAKIELESSRRPATLHIPAKLKAFQLSAGDVVAITHARWNYSGATFQVVQTTLVQDTSKDKPSLGVDLVLRQFDSNVYAFAQSEYSSFGSTGHF